jgi:hypothetical protein
MAEDVKSVELPNRTNRAVIHEDTKPVAKPSDNGRIDLTRTVTPSVTIPPEPKATEEKEPKEAITEAVPADDDLETLKKKRKELEEDNFKYRERSRREREENLELKARLERVEASVSHVSGDKELDEATRQVQSELGIDEDAARKLARTIRNVGRPKTESPVLNSIQQAAQDFQAKALDAMADFPDWESHRTKMTELLQADIKEFGEVRSLRRGPLYYYSESKRLSQGDPESSRAQGRKEMAEKVNQKNLSVSESSRNSQGKPIVKERWTRESIQALARDNPEEYAKRRTEIIRAMNNGEVD